MKTITTDTGQSYQVDYAGVGLNGRFKTQIVDARRLPAIAAELDGVTSIAYNEGDQESHFDGYSRLYEMVQVDENHVIVFLGRETENESGGNAEVYGH